jgi:hypothetical protein
VADTSKKTYQADALKETDEADLYQCADPPVPSPSAPRRKKMATRVSWPCHRSHSHSRTPELRRGRQHAQRFAGDEHHGARAPVSWLLY